MHNFFFCAIFYFFYRDSSWKPKARTQVDLSRVDRVQRGQQTRKFSRFAGKHRSVTGHSLSIIYGRRRCRLSWCLCLVMAVVVLGVAVYLDVGRWTLAVVASSPIVPP